MNRSKAATLSAGCEVFFQPILDARLGTVHHYEALARFASACGMQSPFERITSAERAGLIGDFDAAMARRVMGWLKARAQVDAAIRVAINISGRSISNSACLAKIDALLRANAWARGRLMFEITETAHLGNLAAANANVQRLRRQGFPVCLDDFGAGAADFEYLSSLQVDIVKLDGALVGGARRTRKGKAFLKALVGLCRDLGIASVAEMIEDEAALAFVRDCGVDYVQGYLFGQPERDARVLRPGLAAALFPAGAPEDGAPGHRRLSPALHR